MSSIVKILEGIPSAEEFMEGLPNYMAPGASTPTLAVPLNLDFLLSIDCATVIKDAATRSENSIQPQTILDKIDLIPAVRQATTFI